jgi:glycosyltransferase involved in cell wall biosynthesis
MVSLVGTDSGVIPELIDTAGLVVPEDDVGALTAALQHLTDAPRSGRGWDGKPDFAS